MNCKICNHNTNLILSLDSGYAVSSLGKVLEAKAEIFLCPNCSHCQTNPSIDLFEYYSNEYKTLSVSFDEDDLYSFENNLPVYRNYFQAQTLIRKFSETIKSEINGPVLDYGCGKSLVMKHLMSMTNHDDIYLFDVSNDYIKFWDTFIPKTQYSCFDIPELWNGYFNLVTSFFSLEHVANPLEDLKTIRQLLKNNGYAYIIVPNMYSENISDMLVVDHIQHYSESSMNLLLSLSGFEMIDADHTSHSQGSIYIAKPTSDNQKNLQKNNLENTISKCIGIASYWKEVQSSILKFEQEMIENSISGYYIVGAGFLGTFVSIQLKYPEKLLGFIDSNEHKQKKGWQSKKVFAPGEISGNPAIAILSGLNLVQIKTILPKLLPKDTIENNIWTLEKVNKI